MTPHSDSDAPAIDLGVLSRLRRLDPMLRVTWHKYEIDPRSGTPIRAKATGQPVYHPQFHLWTLDGGRSTYRWIRPYESFGHLQVSMLEQDVARFHRPSEIARMVNEARERAREKALADQKQLNSDRIDANKKRIEDLVYWGKSGKRTAKVASIPGVSRKDSPGEVLADPKEDGWEL